VYADPRCKGFLIRDISHALRRNRNLVTPFGERIREVENVALLATDVRRKELREQKDAHQGAPDGTRTNQHRRSSCAAKAVQTAATACSVTYLPSTVSDKCISAERVQLQNARLKPQVNGDHFVARLTAPTRSYPPMTRQCCPAQTFSKHASGGGLTEEYS
jgi:hypothetical protein